MNHLFSHLVGNESIKSYIIRSIKANCLHHTLLFNGPNGVGKFQFAKALAEKLFCSLDDRVKREIHPDLHILRPEGKSGMHLVESLREMINEVHQPPFESEQKVFIITEAHRMPDNSANMLLKTLEEPNLDTQVILITNSSHEMLPTILSRCVHLNFQGISEEAIEAYLIREKALVRDNAARIAHLSNGSIGSALQIIQEDPCVKAGEILLQALDQKISPIQAISEIDAELSSFEGLEYHQRVEYLFSLYLLAIRDRALAQLSRDPKMAYLLTQAEKKVAKARSAFHRNIRLSSCLEQLLRNSY